VEKTTPPEAVRTSRLPGPFQIMKLIDMAPRK